MVIMLDRWQGKVAIVTGSGSGIGASICKKLVNIGLNVAGLDKREENLKELQNRLQNEPGKFYSIKTDMTNEEDILKAFKWIEINLGPIHILINNAGTRKKTNLIEGSTELWKETFEANVLGLCIATREAVQNMRSNNVDGHIVHINSITGHKVIYLPDSNVYPASKFAVTALTDTLRQELNSIRSKIKITSISPGMVDTEFRVTNELQLSPDSPKLKSEDIADAVLYVLGTPAHVQVHEIIMKPLGESQ